MADRPAKAIENTSKYKNKVLKFQQRKAHRPEAIIIIIIVTETNVAFSSTENRFADDDEEKLSEKTLTDREAFTEKEANLREF